MRIAPVFILFMFFFHFAHSQERMVLNYPNGQKWYEVIREEDNFDIYLQAWDLNGNELLTNGTGYSIFVDSANQITIHEEFKDSVKIKWFEYRHVKNDSIYWKADTSAIYIKGEYQFYKDIELLQRRLVDIQRIKKIKKKRGKEIRIFVVFIINKMGDVTEARIAVPIDEKIDNDHIILVKQLKGWKPAISDGKKVKYRYILPFTY